MEMIKKYGIPALCGLGACYVVSKYTSATTAANFGLNYTGTAK
jgi:hypothetical protein